MNHPSTALLGFLPGDVGGNVAALYDCLFQEPDGDTDALGMVAVTRELVQLLVSSGRRDSAERVRTAARAAFDRAKKLGAAIEEEVGAGGGAGGAGRGHGMVDTSGAAPVEAGDASGMEWLLPEDWNDKDFVLDKGSTLAAQLEQARSWISNVGRYRLLGLDCPTGILLTGPAGTGKSTAAHYLAAKTGRPCCIARQDAVNSRFLGQNLKNLRAMLAAAVEKGALIFFDEVDAIARDRRLAGPNEHHRIELLDSFLEQLTILRKRHPEQVVLAATNVPEVLDPSFVRRVAVTIEFDFLSRPAREDLLAGLYGTVDVEEVARDLLLTMSEGRSGDYLRSVAMTAARAAVDDLDAAALAVLDEQAVLAKAIADVAATAAKGANEEEAPVPPPALDTTALPRPRVTRTHVTRALELIRDQDAARAAGKRRRSGVILTG